LKPVVENFENCKNKNKIVINDSFFKRLTIENNIFVTKEQLEKSESFYASLKIKNNNELINLFLLHRIYKRSIIDALRNYDQN
jgi:hypothetical protein